jgi:hypothetical protein
MGRLKDWLWALFLLGGHIVPEALFSAFQVYLFSQEEFQKHRSSQSIQRLYSEADENSAPLLSPASSSGFISPLLALNPSITFA